MIDFREKVILRVIVVEYIVFRIVFEEEYMVEEFLGEGDYDDEKDCYWMVFGWYESSYEVDVNWRLSKEVIYWMFLLS